MSKGNGMTRGIGSGTPGESCCVSCCLGDGAVIGIDLAEDEQLLAALDHDVRVLARKNGASEDVPAG